MGEFVGAERLAVVDGLVAAFGRVGAGGGPELVCLVGEVGWGKTRIVQELYERLAAEFQGAPSYWPSTMLTREVTNPRKVIRPPSLVVPAGAKLEWMWWGLSCLRGPDGRPLDALDDGHDQLFLHADALLARTGWASRARQGLAGGGWQAKASALAGVLGFFVPVVGSVATVADLALQTAGGGKGLFEARDRRGRLSQERVLEVGSVARGGDRAGELAQSLAIYSAEEPRVPFVVVIDDAHDAGSELLALFDALLAMRSASVLIVATAWPDRLAVQRDDDSGFGAWLEYQARTDRARTVELDPLPDDDLATLIDEVAPKSGPAVRAGLATHAGGNPLALELMLSLGMVQRSIRGGAITLSVAEIAAVPTEIADLLTVKWRELPKPVQEALAVASLQGREFVEPCARDSALLLGLDEAAESFGAAIDPYRWARRIDELLEAFVEPTHHQVATQQAARGLLSTDELDRARAAIVDYAVARRAGPDWDDLSESVRRRLLENHVLLGREGFAGDLGAAADAALELAALAEARHDLTTAIDAGAQAITWLTTSRGPDAPDTLRARSNLALWQAEAGRVDEAIEQFEVLLADLTRVLGPDAPDTLTTRSNLAFWQAEAGRVDEAIEQFEVLLADLTRVLGPDAPDTLRTRNNLASWQAEAGRVDEAIEQFEVLLADQARVLGPDAPDTLRTRNNLASWQARAGRVEEAIEQFEVLLADLTRVLGPDAPDTLRTRNNLASWQAEAGRVDEAIEQFEVLLADQARVLGPDAPDTLRARSNLASGQARTGRVDEAIEQFEVLLADLTRVLGPDAPDTLRARSNLASGQAEAGRVEEAIEQFEVLLADLTRVLGPDAPDTLRARSNLASWQAEAGRVDEAIEQFEVLLADLTRVLGPDAPDTLRIRHNLASLQARTGRVDEAIEQFEVLLADQTRVLGPDAPDTLTTRNNLAYWRRQRPNP